MEEKEVEKKKSTLPPPTIKNTPPAKPPTTTVDAAPAAPQKEEPKKPEEKNEESSDEIVAESENPVGEDTNLNNRILGGLIDGAVCFGLSVAGSIIPLPLFDFIGSLASLAYIITRDSLPFLDGQSLGKKVVGSKAVREDGSSLTGDFKTGAIRNVWMLLFLVEPLVLYIRKDKEEAGRRLGDDFAKTKVINVD